jgi:hypothetical protein
MGLVLYPVEDGDEDKYEIFDVTSDSPWTPRTFSRDSRIFNVKTPNPSTPLVLDIPFLPGPPSPFDPGDLTLPSFGTPALLQLDTSATILGTTDPFLDTLSYDQLTGFDEYHDDMLGFPMDSVPRASRNFNTYAHATKAWHRVMHKDLDPALLRPYLGYRPLEIIKATLAKTTQLAKMVIRYPMRRHIKSRIPHLNNYRLNEVISTDPLFSNVKSIFHGFTSAQVFFGLKSHVINVYGMKHKHQFPDIYRDFIHEQGCPFALRRDNAREECSAEVLRIHRDMFI